jgi:UDP-galactopyranose mutase
MQVDYLVIGSGLTGAVVARQLADVGHEVLVVDRRCHVGGNVHDHHHPSGIRIHTYGPHYFRTASDTIWEFVNRFSRFYRYEAALKALVDGAYENWPIAASYIHRTIGTARPSFAGRPSNFEEASLAMMPAAIYQKFVKGYTEKQWGVPAYQLSATLAGRFDVREDDEPRLKRHKHQGIPEEGYAVFMCNLLAGIPVLLNYDYLRNRDRIRARKLLVYTGPIDEFFGFRFGKLKYRGQRRIHEYLPETDFAQPCGQVNNPSPFGGPHIRTLEWKHMMPAEHASRIKGTVLTREITETPHEPDR